MANHNPIFQNNNFYHAVNFGIDNKIIFNDKKDIDRFLSLLEYYKVNNPPARFAFRNRPIARNSDIKLEPMVEIIAFCLMPNHFHLLLKQTMDNGVNSFMSKVANSYTKYYNARQKRTGTLFKGPFKAREVSQTDLSGVSRHIHLDPLLSGLIRFLPSFPFSSFPQYLEEKDGFCVKTDILKNFSNTSEYKEFVMNQAEYKLALPQIRSLFLENS